MIKKTVFIGNDETVKAVFRDAETIADAIHIPILIYGESGVGKDVLAHYIHDKGPNTKGPFVPINCAAIPTDLIESDLFGHVKGAFTHALHNKLGRFEQANQGTLFLDEISSMPLPLQAKLLRVLQDQIIYPVGSTTGKQVNCRIIAASNTRLTDDVAQGRFRQDLFFRLNGFFLDLPPLRHRMDDFEGLLQFFIDQQCAKSGLAPKRVSSDLSLLLKLRPWPGNLRELQSAVALMVHMCRDQSELTYRQLPHAWTRSFAITYAAIKRESRPKRQRILKALLRVCDHNVSKMANMLQVNRSTLYRQLAK